MSDTLDAAAYDAWFDTRWGRHAFHVERQALLATAGPLVGRQVADVGCGTGRFTAELEHAGARVVGIDLDPAMLEIAATRVSGRLLAGDAHRLPLADDTVDTSVAVTLLEFVDDPTAVLAELTRITHPGGRIVIGSLNPRSPWGLAHRRELSRPPWSAAQLRTRREVGQLLTRAGLGPARWRPALYAPSAFPGLDIIGPVIDRAGRRLAPAAGAFQVAALDLPHPT